MKNWSMFLLGVLVSALLIIVQAIIYAMMYDICITKVVSEFGYQMPKLQFEVFIMIEVFRQLIISGKPSKDNIKVDVKSDEFWNRILTFFFTKIIWIIVCLIIGLNYGK
jgi:hypothetical protein